MNQFIFLLAVAGFAIAFYIRRKKTTEQTLVCIIGRDCNAMVTSAWGAALFGIPNEALGMLYYGFLMAGAGLLYFGHDLALFLPLSLWLLLVSAVAALFSLFLAGVQAFVFKDWCEYCLASTGINLTLFAVEAVPFLALYGFF